MGYSHIVASQLRHGYKDKCINGMQYVHTHHSPHGLIRTEDTKYLQ